MSNANQCVLSASNAFIFYKFHFSPQIASFLQRRICFKTKMHPRGEGGDCKNQLQQRNRFSGLGFEQKYLLCYWKSFSRCMSEGWGKLLQICNLFSQVAGLVCLQQQRYTFPWVSHFLNSHHCLIRGNLGAILSPSSI